MTHLISGFGRLFFDFLKFYVGLNTLKQGKKSMSTYKRIAGDYTIQSVNTGDRIIINSGNVYIEGNLWVSGNTQTYTSNNSSITNHIITLNAGVASPNPAGASIVVSRGTSGQANAAISWNETVGAWQISEVVNGSYYTANIATSIGTQNFISNVVQDTAPMLGGNLNIYNHSIYSNISGVQLWSVSSPGAGGTGLTVTNSTYANVELMSKTKSIVYSIIFG